MTAVQWLLDRIEDVDNTPQIWEQIKIQAKEMERKQIHEAFKHGELPCLFVNLNAEEYYQQTYGNKINLVEIPKEQLEKERNPNYKYFNIKPKP